MKIVQSFWTGNNKDMHKSYGWLESKYHLYGWALSCCQLRKFYDDVELVTDKFGHYLLIEKLQLPYTKVHVILDELNGYNENLWALAKIKAYSHMQEPFLHVDGDVFIWEPFDEGLLACGLITQNIEFTTAYYNEMWSNIFPFLDYVPQSMDKFIDGTHKNAYNMGIFGGNDLEFIKEYCAASLRFVDRNKQNTGKIDLFNFNIFFEQVLFYEMSEIHQKKVDVLIHEEIGDNEYKGFGNFDEVPHKRTYLHLLGFFKRQHEISRKLEVYVLKYYPQYYRKIEDLLDFDVKLSEFNFEYTTKSAVRFGSDYFHQILLQKNNFLKDKLERIVARNLFMEGQARKFSEMFENDVDFVIMQTTDFNLITADNGQQLIEIEELDEGYLNIPLMGIDQIILNELDGSCNRHDFERQAVAYLSDDFPENQRQAFVDTLWKRISYFISINILVAVGVDEIDAAAFDQHTMIKNTLANE
jgi:hypothetical protein